LLTEISPAGGGLRGRIVGKAGENGEIGETGFHCLHGLHVFPFSKWAEIEDTPQAYNMNNPVCNAGSETYHHAPQLRKELNSYGVPYWYVRYYPELRHPIRYAQGMACTGLFIFKTCGLVKKQLTTNNQITIDNEN